MRYRLMASYLGASYQAAVGPSDRDVTLFAAPPPPEEHGFSPVPGGGIWRKQVRLDDLDGLWESRPIGSYHGEPCLVLDDLGDRLHIVYLGMDERRAGQLGYWQVDRGVFEVVVQRHEVTDLAEERHEFPIALLLSALPRALNAGDGGAGNAAGSVPASGSGARAGVGLGNGGNGIGRIALPSGGEGASAASGGISTWNGQSAIGTRQLPAAQPQQLPSGGQQPAGGQQLQPVGQTSMQRPSTAAAADAAAADAPARRHRRAAADDRRLPAGAGNGAERDRLAGRGAGLRFADDAAACGRAAARSAAAGGRAAGSAAGAGGAASGSGRDVGPIVGRTAGAGALVPVPRRDSIAAGSAGARRAAGAAGAARLRHAPGDRRSAVRRCRGARRPTGDGRAANAGHPAGVGHPAGSPGPAGRRRPAAGGRGAASARAAARRRGRVARLAGA